MAAIAGRRYTWSSLFDRWAVEHAPVDVEECCTAHLAVAFDIVTESMMIFYTGWPKKYGHLCAIAHILKILRLIDMISDTL